MLAPWLAYCPLDVVKILLASFHFDSSAADTSLAVAYVYCEPDRVTVEPVHSALEGSPVIRELRELAEAAGDDTYSKLTTISWPYWTFDDVAIH